MPTFVNQPLLWGLAVVAAPVIIHLINLLRHRRVKWAAMEFLLASQRKHSTWIRLKEVLLLLLRMAAVAAVVMIVARPRLTGGLAGKLGDGTTHHVVLLDDSFSMSDRFAERSVFDQAKAAVERIALTALEQSSAQTFTLLRASKAALADGAKPDLYAESVNSEFVFKDRPDRRLNRVLETMQPADSAAGPEACFRGLSALLKPDDAEDRIIYLVSDFRAKDWREAEASRNLLSALEKKVAQIYFVNCTDDERPNLAVTSLRPESGTRAAGVHFFMQVAVRNYGRTTAEKTAVEIRTDGDSGGVVFLDAIEPGKSVLGRFPVFFSNPGEHLISVRLEPDAVEADNRRSVVVNLSEATPVLVVDGAADSPIGRAMAEALSPQGPVRSGLAPQLQLPSFLNDVEKNPLAGFRTIYLANVGRLDPPAVRNLENYVKAGGGLIIVAGDRTDVAFANEMLYRDGSGLLPVPLDSEKQLFRDREAKAADIVPSEHPVFRLFSLEKNSYLYDVTVDKYFGISPDWTPEVASKQLATVMARLRNGAPLAVERPFGKGRVAALLTVPVAPWSDWAKNVSFVVTMLELQSHMSRGDDDGDERRVGAPLVRVFDPKEYLAETHVLPPGAPEGAAVTLQAVAVPEGLKVEYPDTGAAGYYRLELTRVDKTVELQHFAFNVDPNEGELARFNEQELQERLPGVRFFYRRSDRIQPAESDTASSLLSTVILYGLLALLLGEQALAYSASYHPPRLVAAGGKEARR